MRFRRPRRGGRAAVGAWLLPALLVTTWGCGSDEPEQLRTVRSMTSAAAEAETVPDLELPDLEAAESPEPAPRARATNRAPLIRAMQVDPAPRVRGGADVRVVVDAQDPDGDEIELHYTWFVNDEEVEQQGPVFHTTSLARGDHVRVEAVASDGRAESAPMRSPLLEVENGLPRIVSQPQAPGPDGVFRYQVQVEDPEGDTGLRFSLAKGPRGMHVHAVRGLVEWVPEPDQVGVHPVEIVVQDSAGGEMHQSFELSIDAPPAAPAS
jgi:hypothetical protein